MPSTLSGAERVLFDRAFPATEKSPEISAMRFGGGTFAAVVEQAAELIARGELDPSDPRPVALVSRRVKELAVRGRVQVPERGIRAKYQLEERKRLAHSIMIDEVLTPMLIPAATATWKAAERADPLGAVERVAIALPIRSQLLASLEKRGLINGQGTIKPMAFQPSNAAKVRGRQSGSRGKARLPRLADLAMCFLELPSEPKPWELMLTRGADRQLVAEHRKRWSLTEHEARADWRIVQADPVVKRHVGYLTPLVLALESGDKTRIAYERKRVSKYQKRLGLQDL